MQVPNPEPRRLRGKMAKIATLLVSSTILSGTWCGVAIAETTSPPATTAASADTTPGLEAIVVTAQKRSENVQSVPLSVEAVSGQVLRDNSVSGPLDVGKLVPSLKVFNSTISNGIQFRIRGFGSATNSSTDSDVATYLDGAFIARPAAILGAFLDVSNIEVLAGPQGTLFGRNAAMGAVSISTNAPTAKTSVDASVEGGSFGTYKGKFVANAPLTDNFDVRGAFQASHTDGDFFNEFNGKHYGASDNYVGRISAKWSISPSATWIVRVDGSKTTGDGANPLGVDTATASQAQLSALSNFVTSHGGTPPVLSSNPSHTINNYIGNAYEDDREIGVTSNLIFDVAPKISIRLIDNYRNWSNDSGYPDAAGTTLNIINAQQYTKSISTSHELQFVSEKDAFLNGKAGLTAGIYYYHEVYDIDVTFNIGSDYCHIVFGARAPSLVGPCLAGPQADAGFAPYTQTTDSYAGYAQFNYALLPNVELDLGGRETYEKKTGTMTQVANNPLAIDSLLAPEGPDALSLSETKPSMRASLSWHPTADAMIFGTYSTGYKSGGFNAGESGVALGSAARTFAAETVKDVELGFKTSFLNNRLIFNATFFYTKLFNFQDRSFNGLGFLIRNAGNVRSQGVDMNGRFRALPNLIFDYGATYLDSIYATNTDAPGLEGCAAIPGTTTPANPACPLVQDLSGKLLPYSPKWQLHIGANWKVASVNGFDISATAGESYSSGYQTATTDNPQAMLPGFATTDLRLGIASPDGRWKFELFGTNVFNKQYFVATVAQPLAAVMPGVNNGATGATLFRGFLGDPARYGARISASF